MTLGGCASKSPRPNSGGASSSPSSTHDVIPLVGSYKVNRFQLENGLNILVVEDHTSPTLAYQTWFRVGSRDEVPNYTGLAHLFEHMMFKGTKEVKEGIFDKILEGAGAEGENAFTTQDYTVYVQEMPKDKLDLIAKLEADRMVNLVVNEESFKTEREVVQNERRFRTENNVDGTMEQELFSLTFTKHPYHWPVIGYKEDLDRMTAEDASKFYHAFYSPNHATLMVIGDVNPDQVYETVKKYYGSLKKQDAPALVIDNEPAQVKSRSKTLKLNTQVEKLMMGYPIPAITHADMPALNILQNVMVGGKSSRLYRSLVETGISASVDGGDFENKDPSLFLFVSNLQKGKKATLAESVVRKELDKLGNELVSDKELERAKNQLAFAFNESLSSNSQKAHFLGHWESIGHGFQEGLKSYEKTQAVTAQELQAVVKKYFQPKLRNVVIGVPK